MKRIKATKSQKRIPIFIPSSQNEGKNCLIGRKWKYGLRFCRLYHEHTTKFFVWDVYSKYKPHGFQVFRALFEKAGDLPSLPGQKHSTRFSNWEGIKISFMHTMQWSVKFLYTSLYNWSDLMICFDSEHFPQNFVWQYNNDQKGLELHYECLK